MLIFFSLISFIKHFNSTELAGTNFYQVTGLKQTSTEEEILKSYKSFLKRKGAVVNPTEQIQKLWNQIEFAYTVLGAEHSKALYDLFGIDFLNVTQFRTIGYHSDEALEAIKKMMGRVPQEMAGFGGMVYFPVQFDLLDFLTGSSKEIASIHTVECQCPNGGNKCPKCKHSPYVEEVMTQTIELPPGAPEFHRIIGRGMGDTPNARGASDVIFVAQSKYHDKFIRDGKHLRINVSLSLRQAIKGDRIQIEGIDGEMHILDIESVQHLEERRIFGKGLPDFLIPSQRGDIIATFFIDFPNVLSESQIQRIIKILPDNDGHYE